MPRQLTLAEQAVCSEVANAYPDDQLLNILAWARMVLRSTGHPFTIEGYALYRAACAK